MEIYWQLELNKLSITNYDQVSYEHAKFQVNQQFIKEGCRYNPPPPPERKRVEKYHLRESVKGPLSKIPIYMFILYSTSIKRPLFKVPRVAT